MELKFFVIWICSQKKSNLAANKQINFNYFPSNISKQWLSKDYYNRIEEWLYKSMWQRGRVVENAVLMANVIDTVVV